MNTQRTNADAKASRRIALITLVVACVLAPGSSRSQNQMYIYPAKGQSPQQQDKDRYECHSWAVQQTGFDPSRANPGNPNAYDPQPRSGQVVRGAAGGAAIGAIGGAIGGNAGKGAAIGAAAGGGVGALRRRQDRNQQQQQQQSQAQAQNAQVQGYQRAMAACLQGRGYTIN